MAKNKSGSVKDLIPDLLPPDGSPMGNQSLREQLAAELGRKIGDKEYEQARDELIAEGVLGKGKGRGGSVYLTKVDTAGGFSLTAQPVQQELGESKPAKARQAPGARGKKSDEPDVLSYRHTDKRINNPDVGLVTPDTDRIAEPKEWKYDPHIDPALQFDIGRSQIEKLIDDALASKDEGVMRAALEQLKRQAEPYLNWTGKAERTSFDVDTVSLHVHERIDPATILATVRKRMKGEKGGEVPLQEDFLKAWFEEPLPLREAIDFYKHERGWANRLIAGDSLLVMNSLLQKESMAGQVQMIYMDPPYGIKYGSNFQPFTNKRDVKDRRDEDLTQEPEMIKAFRDTWELGIHSYLTYLRDRLLLAKELLHESGSVFVQIGEENVHLARNVLDEVFGSNNYVLEIIFKKTSGAGSPSGGTEVLASVADYILWYAKDREKISYNQLYRMKGIGAEGGGQYTWIVTDAGEFRPATETELASSECEDRIFSQNPLTSQSSGGPQFFPFAVNGIEYVSGNSGWKTTREGMHRLHMAQRLMPIGKNIRYVRYFRDFPVYPYNNFWEDTITSGFGDPKVYVVQTNSKVIERCMLMTTKPGDLVFDPTCGSGTTAVVAEKTGRRWITCDTSRVSVTLSKQRLMTASYDYYDLKYPHEGLKAGFIYKTVPHVALKSIANNSEIDEIHKSAHPAVEKALQTLNSLLHKFPPPKGFVVSEGDRSGKKLDFSKKNSLQEWEVPFNFPDDWSVMLRPPFSAFHEARKTLQLRIDRSIAEHADQEILYDQPQISKDKLRICGPFTVEAVPFPSVKALDEMEQPQEADTSVARSGESGRQHAWRDELLKTGIRGKGGQSIRIAALETVPGLRYIHASGLLADNGKERVVVSFGPEYAALEQRQVEMAMREAGELFPRPKMIVFCAFTFDPEAAKDIDQTKGITALKVQMNTDLLTEDLKKARASNQSFWLMGQPDVEVRKTKDGKYQVEVNGFDYFDTVKGDLIGGGKGKIAMWLLDTDYDERSLFPRQVFFPMAGKKDGWEKLKKNIRAELNESLLEKFHGTVSLPFEAGENRKVAVKIIDDRGIESLKIINLE